MPINKSRIPPSGPFVDPDAAGSDNGLPLARMRCIAAAGDLALTDTSGDQTAEFLPTAGNVLVPGTIGAWASDYRLQVAARFLNRKTGSTTNSRVDINVEVYNADTATWYAAGGAADLWFSPETNQNAVTTGTQALLVPSGSYTKCRLILAANAANAATNSLAGMLGAGLDGNAIDVELYKVV